jgi:hypothetical protein
VIKVKLIRHQSSFLFSVFAYDFMTYDNSFMVIIVCKFEDQGIKCQNLDKLQIKYEDD